MNGGEVLERKRDCDEDPSSAEARISPRNRKPGGGLMKSGSILMSLLLAAGCSGPADRPLIEGPLRFLELKTSETTHEGNGGFTVPVHARLYREYLLVTYNPARSTSTRRRSLRSASGRSSSATRQDRQPNPYGRSRRRRRRLSARKAVPERQILHVHGAGCYDSATSRSSYEPPALRRRSLSSH